MRLLKYNTNGIFSLTEFVGSDIPLYAILSHTWGRDGDEVIFKDIVENTGNSKVGYNKIKFCGKQAEQDGIQYFWVDTCCIDKSSSTGLSEAINSMFRWYRNAAKCYVFLADVSKHHRDKCDTVSQFRKSRWFTRGWTLQELIASPSVEFFSGEWERLGDKQSLESELHEITRIAIPALRGNALTEFNVAERMSWAEKRVTKREEDKAYSLFGIFDVHMPLIYGEGQQNAFRRLHEEINKASRNYQHEEQPKTHPTPWIVPFERNPRFTDNVRSRPNVTDKQIRNYEKQDNGDDGKEIRGRQQTVCYKCRKSGHYANEPHCYKCGEYGHFANEPHCYKCGEYGHYANEPHCYRCGSWDHFWRDCRE